jgi:hypothetical protein
MGTQGRLGSAFERTSGERNFVRTVVEFVSLAAVVMVVLAPVADGKDALVEDVASTDTSVDVRCADLGPEPSLDLEIPAW